MGWKKSDIVKEAFAELGMADYDFDIQPEESMTALRRMDAMMATWAGKGIILGYPLPGSPAGSNIDQESGLPDAAVETVVANLAVRIAPGFNKQINPATVATAKQGYLGFLTALAIPRELQFPNTLPLGQGNRPWLDIGRPYFPTPNTDPAQFDAGGNLDFLGG